MVRKKTHEEFVSEVKALVGEEYTVVGIYTTASEKVDMRHNNCETSYRVRPGDFFAGKRCPECSGNKKKTTEQFKKEVFDLVGEEYEVLGEYNGAHSKLKMYHKDCSEIYSVTPASFLKGRRCSNCFQTKKKTTEQFKREVFDLVGEEYEVLGEYKSNRYPVEIFHKKCGEIYLTYPTNFLRGAGCSKCARNKKKTTEQFKKEVYDLSGGEYEVLGKYKSANDKIKILHKTCGDTYLVQPCGFIGGKRCAKCSGNKRKTTDEFSKEVAELDSEYTLVSEYKNANAKVTMRHGKCGHTYKVRPYSYLAGSRCPKCRESKGEKRIREWLNCENIEFKTQKPIKYSAESNPLLLDFYVQGVAIEYDGELHYKSVEHFGGDTALAAQQKRDQIKNRYCADNGIPLIRIPYWDFENIDAILTRELLPLLGKRTS